ncbi:unannotated protein [freshwater metagenome]|uniref:Unannotated protein n=1 Tax=freshwater metagenome TaxID=449393 RepID=A0A6J6I1G7_9ZZZZ|nr:hypothetical protein [Actinomycetota bacterium]
MTVIGESSARRSLLLHVGLPKTGTTTIQNFIQHNSDAFSQLGVGVLSVEGLGAHYLLANHLKSLDGAQRESSFFANSAGRTEFFPGWTREDVYLISAEDLCIIGPNGATAIGEFASAHNAALTVHATIRNPIDWLWSCWTQVTKSEWFDWSAWIDRALEHRDGFLSRSLGIWLEDESVGLGLMTYEGLDLLPRFLHRTGLAAVLESDLVDVPSANIGLGPVESLYLAMFVRDVRSSLTVRHRIAYIDPDWGYIERLLLDSVDLGAPTFEVAQKYERHVLDLADGEIFGPSVFDGLAAYGEAWVNDALEFLERGTGRLDEESVSTITRACAALEADVEALLDGSFDRIRFPQRNFADRLPIDSQYLGLVRSVATMIHVGERVKRNSEKT